MSHWVNKFDEASEQWHIIDKRLNKLKKAINLPLIPLFPQG
jgi:hypothetical protein